MIRQDINQFNVPDSPGVYFFRDKDDKILYIGKATSLRDRTRSYFAPDLIKTRGPLIVDMVFLAQSVTFEETLNTLEALILEANLIRKYKPYYNTKEKDDKSFNCVVITKEIFPRIILVRQKDINLKSKTVTIPRKGGDVKYDSIFGPYPNTGAIREALYILRRIFPFRDLASSKKDSAIFYRQIGLSPDLSDEIAIKKYKKNIGRIKCILQGKMRKLINDLKKEMNDCASKWNFEEANELKQKIFALEHVQDVSLIKRDLVSHAHESTFRIEAFDIAHISGTSMVGVMVVVEDGRSKKSDYRKFTIKGFDKSNDAGALSEVLSRRFTHKEWPYPNALVVDGNIIQTNAAKKVLKDFSLNIPVVAVTKDDRHKAKSITGPTEVVESRKYDILLANSESHRFALSFHKQKRKKAQFAKFGPKKSIS